MESEAVEKRLEVAEAVAREAGQLALGYFRRRADLAVGRKGLQDVVSEADGAVERLIRERLAERFPGDGFLGEETGASEGVGDGPVWVVDPIDGTQCFLAGIPSWCVSIGLAAGGRCRLGVIYDPCFDEIFVGGDGRSTTCNGVLVSPIDAASLEDGMIEVGFSHRVKGDWTAEVVRRVLSSGGMYHRGGTGALALAYVAAGRYIAYYEEHMNAWDSVAGIGLIEAAGGWAHDVLADDGLRRGAVVAACGARFAPTLRALVDLG